MNKSKRFACVLGIFAVIAWPVPAGSALADDAHHAHRAGDEAHAAAKAAAPKKDAAPSSHDVEHGATKAPSKTVRVSPSSDKHGEHPADRPVAKSRLEQADAHAAKPAPKAKAASKHADIEVTDTPASADDALRLLEDGNQRWVSGASKAPNTDSARRTEVAEHGQKPFVTVLTCADSRVPVERVFDRGVGEVFTVRVAGNIAGGSETGTIEYGVGHLKTPLLVVMGHTKCGAVAAAATDAKVHGRVAELINAIKPAVDRAKKNNPGSTGQEIVPAAVRENVWQSIFDLIKGSPDLRTLISSGELKIVGAVYDIASGKVDFMGEHPWQAELVEAMNARAASRSETAEATEPSH